MAEKKFVPSPEEREALAQLVRSPGWFIVMREILIPVIQHATHQLDTIMAIPESTRSVQRGVKYALTAFTKSMYDYAALPNPLVKHFQALLTTVRELSGVPEEDTEEDTHWIIYGHPACGLEGIGPWVRGAGSKETITCPGCMAFVQEDAQPRRDPYRPSTPV